jgi:putative variant cofactor biosynthesis B12-binding/radical SAM domain protein 1
MRILLIQAISALDGGERVFPLGLARLASSLGDRHELQGLDLNLNPYPWAELVKTLDRFRPELVAVSFRNLDPLAGSLVSFVPHLKTLAALLRRHAPESRVILGGSGFTLFARRIMAAIPEIDLGLCGEADLAFPLLVEGLDAPMTVPGMLWRRDDGSLGGSTPRCCEDLDSLPFPNWTVFAPRRYDRVNQYVAFMGVETKRGCPNSCRYCLYPALQGRRVRLRSPVRVVDELEMLRAAHQLSLVHFTDPVVNQPAEHLRAICSEILRRRLTIGWTGFFREDALSEADVELYLRAGLASWYFSADGASDHALRLLGKGLSRDDVLRAARLAAASGVVTVYHFLVNLPGETQGTTDESRRLIEGLFDIHARRGNLGAVVINNLRLYPGAPLTEQVLREGLIDPRTDLLYPTYFNPPPWDHLRHELTAFCMQQGTLSFLNPGLPGGSPPKQQEAIDAHPAA